MTLNDLRVLIRLYVPSAKTARVTNATLNILINQGVDIVNIYASAYKANEKFTITAETPFLLL